MAEILLVNVSKIYDDGTLAVKNLSLEICEGEFVAVVGPSGCGKTTALRMIAGLEQTTEGEIRIGGRTVNDVPARKRDLAMVFQNYALYPDKTVRNNLAFPLRLRRIPRAEIDRRVMAVAKTLGLEEQLPRKPRQLSGGQRQRVAMGRAIIREPQAFLMDEPLSNLDAKLRTQMRAELGLLSRQLGITTVYVTHDQIEAMTLGHRVVVMRHGVLQQADVPQTLYQKPVNIFVAGFVGSPTMNFLSGTLIRAGERLAVRLSDVTVVGLDQMELALHPRAREAVGSPVVLGVRPESLTDARVSNTASDRVVKGNLLLREVLGSDVLAYVTVSARAAHTEDVKELLEDAEQGVGAAEAQFLRSRTDSSVTLIARLDPRSQQREGETVELAVAAGSLRLFDPSTGNALY